MNNRIVTILGLIFLLLGGIQFAIADSKTIMPLIYMQLGLGVYSLMIGPLTTWLMLPWYGQLSLADKLRHLWARYYNAPVLAPITHVSFSPPARGYGKAAMKELLSLGFVPSHNIVPVFEKEFIISCFTHPDLGIDAAIVEGSTPLMPTIIKVNYIRPDAVLDEFVSTQYDAPRFMGPPPGGVRLTVHIRMSVRDLVSLASAQKTPGCRPLTPEESLRWVMKIRYGPLWQIHRNQFNLTGPGLAGFDRLGPKTWNAMVAIYRRQWDTLHTGLLLRHWHKSGETDNKITPAREWEYIAGHADQTSEEFLSRLVMSLGRNSSPGCRQAQNAVNAYKKICPVHATGLDACAYLLAQGPAMGLAEVERFDEPVKAILCKVG